MLHSCRVGEVGARALAQALSQGALPNLKCLDLHNNRRLGDGVVALAQAITTIGALRSLEQLHLHQTGMNRAGAIALLQALRGGKPCPHLTYLSLGHNEKIGDAGVLKLAKTIEAGPLPRLGGLELSEVSMTKKGLKAVIKAVIDTAPGADAQRE